MRRGEVLRRCRECRVEVLGEYLTSRNRITFLHEPLHDIRHPVALLSIPVAINKRVDVRVERNAGIHAVAQSAAAFRDEVALETS